MESFTCRSFVCRPYAALPLAERLEQVNLFDPRVPTDREEGALLNRYCAASTSARPPGSLVTEVCFQPNEADVFDSFGHREPWTLPGGLPSAGAQGRRPDD